MARSEVATIGALLLIAGVIGYFIPMPVTMADTTVNLTIPQVVAFCDSGLGSLAQLSPQVVMVCSQYNTFMFGIYGAGLIGIILIIVGAVTGGTKELIYNVDTGKTDYRSEEEDDSLKILKERYAKGEITKEEFEQKKKDLENS